MAGKDVTVNYCFTKAVEEELRRRFLRNRMKRKVTKRNPPLVLLTAALHSLSSQKHILPRPPPSDMQT